ncbi:MAG: response regulator transcription factor [Chiayiivirga sp.]|jgi:two-component system OmpR family response regulator|uniref:response regulator transcription factor n=1 Tax=Chiayiivirga sp. TaxID=2041042 RepID=UPI0025C234BD|nr:response regulator transcription factor [Chiayiivirga sp.]MCI1710066.1 response regulator transcription factor [Chiayiivirga sp.]MCI1729141.1 response regulator transcription factor [Chiayiivirga sp.]
MRILVAEDDESIGGRVRAALGEAGFAVDLATDGRQAEFLGQTEVFDLAVLDLGLPGMDGISVLHRWREAGQRFPVIVLTARSRWHDKLAGFDAGADDYLTKPFQMEELVVRVRALIRRATGHASPVLHCGPLEFDTHAARFSVGGEALALTSQEFRILAYLIHHSGKLVTRAELGEHVYEGGYDPDSNVLDVLIGRIRRKLGLDLIRTVRGQGFRLAAPTP